MLRNKIFNIHHSQFMNTKKNSPKQTLLFIPEKLEKFCCCCHPLQHWEEVFGKQIWCKAHRNAKIMMQVENFFSHIFSFLPLLHFSIIILSFNLLKMHYSHQSIKATKKRKICCENFSLV